MGTVRVRIEIQNKGVNPNRSRTKLNFRNLPVPKTEFSLLLVSNLSYLYYSWLSLLLVTCTTPGCVYCKLPVLLLAVSTASYLNYSWLYPLLVTVPVLLLAVSTASYLHYSWLYLLLVTCTTPGCIYC